MKRFLSQKEVPWAWALKQGLGDPYKLHQWIWDSLPDDPDAKRDFLFRSDVTHGILRVLLLSERVPPKCPPRFSGTAPTISSSARTRRSAEPPTTDASRSSTRRRCETGSSGSSQRRGAKSANWSFPRRGSSSSEKGAARVRARYARSTPPVLSSSRTKKPSAPPSTPASVPPRDSASAFSSFNPFNSNSQPTRTKQ